MDLMRPSEEHRNSGTRQEEQDLSQETKDRNKGARKHEFETIRRSLRGVDLLEEDEREREREAQNETRKLVGEAQTLQARAPQCNRLTSWAASSLYLHVEAAPPGIRQQFHALLHSRQRLFKLGLPWRMAAAIAAVF